MNRAMLRHMKVIRLNYMGLMVYQDRPQLFKLKK